MESIKEDIQEIKELIYRIDERQQNDRKIHFDHEKRIRSLERKIWTTLSALVVSIGVIGKELGTYIMNLLNHK